LTIVESLLIEKPDNPIGFIVEFLQKKYPDQAGVSLATGASQHDREQAAVDGAPDIASDVDDDDDNDDDYIDEIPTLTKNSAYNRDRKRESVCAEVVMENQDDIKEFDKTPEERMRILEILECIQCPIIGILAASIRHGMFQTTSSFPTLGKGAKGICGAGHVCDGVQEWGHHHIAG